MAKDDQNKNDNKDGAKAAVEFALTGMLANMSMKMCDDFVDKNASVASKAGLVAILIRETHGTPCEFCAELAGRYDYENRPSGIRSRHKGCQCTIDFKTERKPSWSRREEHKARAARNKRIQLNENISEKLTRDVDLQKERSSVFNFKIEDRTKIQRKIHEQTIDVVRVRGHKMPVTVSTYEAGNLTRKELRSIEKSTTRTMRLVGIRGKQYPELCILNDKEIGIGTIASYSPIDNRIYVTRVLADPKRTVQMQQASGIYACPEHPDSSMLHEMQHYKDALEYRKNGGEIKDKDDYIGYLNYLKDEYKIKLEELGINEQRISNISEYARIKFNQQEYDEVYAEYIVKDKLKRR